ncbi:hypothetical protein H5410_027928 [Solanum commersonii]|uniref:Uncharacterized protein n=1 Tax=Solanum commersonii TaxID=4109 RepID=A0A9J5Z4S4_SOLCO|nr:hypothetical protein H5410_027928 [Solanum commersonii]
MAVSCALSMNFGVLSRELFSPFPQSLTSTSLKRRGSHSKVSAKLGGGEGDVKKDGKKKFITKEQEPEQYVFISFFFTMLIVVEGEVKILILWCLEFITIISSVNNWF